MGGTKRKITIERIEEKNRQAVTFSKRRHGIYSKAAELCQLSGAQIAILVSPVSSNSHVSFYSFGHSSVDSVVSAFLKSERPREEDTVSKFWWEDESLAQSENPNELKCAMNSISSMLHQVKALRAEKQRDHCEGLELVLHALDIPSTSSSLYLEDDLGLDHVEGEEQITAISDDNNGLLVNLETKELGGQGNQTLDCDKDYLGLEGNNSEGQEQIIARSDYNNKNNGLLVDLDGCEEEFSLDQGFDFMTETEGTLINLDMDDHNLYSAFEEDGTLVMVQTDSNEGQIETISDNNNISLNGCNQELDLDQINSKGLLEDALMVTNTCSDAQVVIHKDLDQDNLLFSDYFNDLTPISDLPTNCSHQELHFDQINSLEDVSMVTNMCSSGDSQRFG